MKTNHTSSDKIIIKGARFSAKIGVSDEERKTRQDLLIDIELFADLRKCAITDSIEDTINYSDVYKAVFDTVAESECRLLEALAENISVQLFKNFNAEKLVIRIIKPKALKGKAEECGIEMTRVSDGYA